MGIFALHFLDYLKNQQYNINTMKNIIEALEWRYATKEFDTEKKLSDEQLKTLKTAINLTATSMGMQPFKVMIISDKEIKDKLFPVSYNQPQITTASHLFLFCAIEKIDSQYAEEYINLVAKVRNQPIELLDSFSQMVNGFVDNFDDSAKLNWASKQAYIAIGNLLTTCALEEIDACPMEGFLNDKYSEILGLDKLGLKPLALVATGFRNETDKYAKLKKVRKAEEDLFI